MRLYQCFVLIILVVTTKTSYQEDDNEFQEVRRDSEKRAHLNKRLLWQRQPSDFSSVVALEAERRQSNEVTTTLPPLPEPVRIAIFNSGHYDAEGKINYVQDRRQIEIGTGSKIDEGRERSMFIPYSATNIRIRIRQADITDDKYILDIQLPNVQNKTELCYILAGTGNNPVYGLCPNDYVHTLKAWID